MDRTGWTSLFDKIPLCEGRLGTRGAGCVKCIVPANEEARQALYANDGIHLLEAYLARWAAFEAAYGAN